MAVGPYSGLLVTKKKMEVARSLTKKIDEELKAHDGGTMVVSLARVIAAAGVEKAEVDKTVIMSILDDYSKAGWYYVGLANRRIFVFFDTAEGFRQYCSSLPSWQKGKESPFFLPEKL